MFILKNEQKETMKYIEFNIWWKEKSRRIH